MTANGKRSYVLKNLTSNRMRASRTVTYETSAKYCNVLFIYGGFKPYFVKLSLFMFVLFLKLVSLYF